MKAVEFCYWLQGHFELDTHTPPTKVRVFSANQVELIRRHLALVFKHEIDPSYGDEAHQEELSDIHEGDIHEGNILEGGIQEDNIYAGDLHNPGFIPGSGTGPLIKC